MHFKSFIFYSAVILLITGIFVDEAEGRRKILRGRKTINRRYYRGTAIPAWSIVLMTGLGMLLLGGGLYLLLNKFIIDAEYVSAPVHSYTPAMQNDP